MTAQMWAKQEQRQAFQSGWEIACEPRTLHKELQVINNAESGRNNSFPGKKNKPPNEASQTE